MTSSALNRLLAPENVKRVWRAGWKKGKRAASGTDEITPVFFNANLDYQVREIRALVKAGYKPVPLRPIPIEKPNSNKKRLICVPTVRDRLMQRVLLEELEKQSPRLGIQNEVSFGFVKEISGIKRGVIAARDLAVSERNANAWVVKADISSFFDKIPRNELFDILKKRLRLPSLMPLLREMIHSEIDESDGSILRIMREQGIVRGVGLRQGMPLSPFLSNVLMRDFDQKFIGSKYRMIRYVDDFMLFCDTESSANEGRELAESLLDKHGLKLNTEKTVVVAPNDAVTFLGMEIVRQDENSKYRLVVSGETMEKIKSKFTEFHDWEKIAKLDTNAASLLSRIQNIKRGYITAYGAAHNKAELCDAMDKWAKTCAERIYGSIFGKAAIAALNPAQRKFLLIE